MEQYGPGDTKRAVPDDIEAFPGSQHEGVAHLPRAVSAIGMADKNSSHSRISIDEK